MVDSKKIEKLSQLLKESRYTVVLTGAGISTESGVPDFRSKDGWWKRINPSEVAAIEALENNYELFREFYKYRIKLLKSSNFNTGHKILADWEKEGIIKAIATQNVDGFHTEAGSKKVYELHGSISDIGCSSCSKGNQTENLMNDKLCEECGGKLRPGVVLFGESLPSSVWEKAYEEIAESDLLIVIGTSLNVSPVNSLPFAAKGKKVLINKDKTQFDNIFDLVVNESIGIVLNAVNDVMN
ncbi:MAG: NAD-dependent deacylase [Eubacteriales bacterium]|nr:NAD-dependent deacylase [Eubacteriales bacterium]